MPMRTAILERHRRPVFGAEEHDGLAENDPPQRLPADLMIGCRDVPVVSEKHGRSPSNVLLQRPPHWGCKYSIRPVRPFQWTTRVPRAVQHAGAVRAGDARPGAPTGSA